MKNRLLFGKMYQKVNKLGLGVEIGVQRGHNLVNIFKSGWNGKVLAVDVWNVEDEFNEAKANLSPYNVEMVKALSTEAANGIPDASLDWVYIDAEHTFKGIYSDLYTWYPKVREGGIISGHDYLDGNYDGYLNAPYGVKEVVDNFVRENKKELHVTTDDTYDGYHFDSWWFIK